MIRGQECRPYLKFLDQLGDLDPNLTHGRGTQLRLLLRAYDDLSNGSTSRQARGYKFETLVYSLFETSKVPVIKSFTRNRGGEQIDGAIQLVDWYYLVECRWRAKKTSPREVDAFHTKVGRSGHQTMGLFISVNGWSSSVVDLLKKNPAKRVLLMNGEDIRAVLAGSIPLVELLRAKVEALNLKSEPFVSVAEILSKSSN